MTPVALGVLSGNAPAHARRRMAIRDSWLQFARHALTVRFVVRCNDSATATTLHDEVQQYPTDMLCLPLAEGCRSAGCRTRGTILALVYWLRYALTAFPTAQMIAKVSLLTIKYYCCSLPAYLCVAAALVRFQADDDVFLFTPDLEAHWSSIPVQLRSFAYYGSIKYFHMTIAPAAMQLRAWAPTHSYAVKVAKAIGLTGAACNSSSSCSVIGPFPYACGQLFALGRGLAQTLVSHSMMAREERFISSLPDDNPLVTEDGWLGSAIFRFIGCTKGDCGTRRRHAVSLFNLAGENHLFIEPTDYSLVATKALVVYHNRNAAPNPAPRWYKRMRTLYQFASATHCTTGAGWRARPSTMCCGPKTDSVDQVVDAGQPIWPVFRLRVKKGCLGSHVRHNLANATLLALIGDRSQSAATAPGQLSSTRARLMPTYIAR